MDWKRYRKKIKKYDTKKELQILSYTIQATLRTIFISSTYNYPSKPIHDCYLLSKIRLVLFLTLYKFIVWACWVRTQSCFGFQVRTVLTYRYTINKIMHLNKPKKKKKPTDESTHVCKWAFLSMCTCTFSLLIFRLILGKKNCW